MSDTSADPRVAVVRRLIRTSALIAALMLTTSCKTSEDAAAAASQMAITARDLAGYYTQMDLVVENTIRLNRLQSVLLGTTFNEQDLAQLKETGQEIEKREKMARSLREVSADFSRLTGAKTSEEAKEAAGRLGTALSSIGSLPGAGALPGGLGEAGKQIELFVQERREREAGRTLDGTATALSQLFQQERPAYDALYLQYYVLAQSLAKELLKRGWVNEGELLDPIVQPFGLAPPASSPEIHTNLKAYAQEQLDRRMAEHTAAEKAASDGMSKALDEMAKRIHQLASDRAMDQRTAPVTLAEVEKWIDTAAAATSGND